VVIEALEWAAVVVDGVGVLVMLTGFTIAIANFIASLWRSGPADRTRSIQLIRCNLGTYLVFALELMIVSDLLHSVMSHQLEDLYFLAALVALRTTIAYFLNKEIQELSPAGNH
jgi:uncharacterized membrane protein